MSQREDREGTSPPELGHALGAGAEEHARYARWIDLGTTVGFVGMLAAFALYVLGILAPQVPPAKLPELWGLPAGEFLAATGASGGWSWFLSLGRGESLNLLGVALLAGCSVAALAATLFVYLRHRNRLYAALCAAEILIIALAASGLLAGGH